MFGFLRHTKPKPPAASQRSAELAQTSTQQHTDIQRELIRVVLKDTLRLHGVPAGWFMFGMPSRCGETCGDGVKGNASFKLTRSIVEPASSSSIMTTLAKLRVWLNDTRFGHRCGCRVFQSDQSGSRPCRCSGSRDCPSSHRHHMS